MNSNIWAKIKGLFIFLIPIYWIWCINHARKVKEKKYYLYALIYFIPQAALIISMINNPENPNSSLILTLFWLPSFIICMNHRWKTCKKLVEEKTIFNKTVINQNQQDKLKELININSATAEEIAELPGFNIVLAKKLVNYRLEIKCFNNIDEIVDLIGLKPHIRESLSKSLTFDQEIPNQSFKPKENNKDSLSGRVIDF